MANHKPVRLCVGCRTRDNATNLVRVAAEGTDDTRSLVLDERGVLPGRGAWLHRDPACFSQALRKRAFGRAFRCHVHTERLDEVLQQWDQENTTTPNTNESGSEI